MSLTLPRLRRGSVPATTVATAGMGGARPLPPHPPAGNYLRHGFLRQSVFNEAIAMAIHYVQGGPVPFHRHVETVVYVGESHAAFATSHRETCVDPPPPAAAPSHWHCNPD